MVFSGKIIFAVVIYKVQVSDSETLRSLSINAIYISGNHIYIYDNSPISQASDAITLFDTKNISLHYVHNPTNPGVSKAYNEAGNFAANSSLTHIVFLDQDTQLTSAYFIELNILLQKEHIPDILIPKLFCGERMISPTNFLWGRFWQLDPKISGEQKIRHKTALNSGLVVSLKSFRYVGGYDESFPLDLSDHVFIYRFTKKYSSIYIMSAILQHNLSVLTEKDEDKIFKRYQLQRIASHHFAMKTGNFLHYFWSLILGIRYSIRFKTIKFMVSKKNEPVQS